MAPSRPPFGAVVVTNYLHRPLFPALLDALEPGGVLLYETFMEGNERFGRPSQPRVPAEGRRVARPGARPLSVTAYEARLISEPRMAMVQRIAARRALIYSAALAIAALCSIGAAYFRSCVSDGTILRASATLPGRSPPSTKPAFSPPASASTSPHGATATEWP